MTPSGIEKPDGNGEERYPPTNPLQPLSKSWIDRILRFIGSSDEIDQLPGTIVVHPCVINDRQVLVYERGLAERDPAALTRLRDYAQENGLALKEDQRSGERQLRFDQRLARSVPTLMLAGGLFIFNHAAYAAGSGKFRDWLLGEEAQARPVAGETRFDNASEACLTCHDGRRGQYIAVRSAGSPMQFDSNSGISLNHPVGMDYLDAAASKPGEYNAVPSLNSEVKLVEGKVACVSCHKLKDPSEMVPSGFIKVGATSTGVNDTCTASGELTAGPRVTDLCLACHNK